MATRINPYKDIHKGLRKLLVDLLLQAGCTDARDKDQVGQLHLQFARVQDLLEIHSEVEDSLLTPLIAACGEQAALQQIRRDHEQLDRDIRDLDRQLVTMLADGAGDDSGLQFYLDLSRYVGVQLSHMVAEEQQVWPLLHRQCSDEQMVQVQVQARQMTPPAAMQTLLQAMIPAVNAAERHLMLGKLREAMPSPAFENLCAQSETLLPMAERQKLQAYLASAPTA